MDQQEILDLGQRWAEAERNMDFIALEPLLAEDFVGVGPLGFVLNRTQWIERYRSGSLRNTAFTFEDVSVRSYNDAAIAVGVQAQNTNYQGHDSSGRYRVTQVYVKQGVGWKIASIHLSGPMPDMPPR